MNSQIHLFHKQPIMYGMSSTEYYVECRIRLAAG
jgi:hypothetical protein